MSKKPLPPSATADKFVARLPDGLRDAIAEAAKANGRSMNAEIVFRLEESLFTDRQNAPADTTGITDPKLKQLIERIEQAIDQKFEKLAPGKLKRRG